MLADDERVLGMVALHRLGVVVLVEEVGGSLVGWLDLLHFQGPIELQLIH